MKSKYFIIFLIIGIIFLSGCTDKTDTKTNTPVEQSQLEVSGYTAYSDSYISFEYPTDFKEGRTGYWNDPGGILIIQYSRFPEENPEINSFLDYITFQGNNEYVNITFLKKEIDENEALFETKSQTENRRYHSKERMIICNGQLCLLKAFIREEKYNQNLDTINQILYSLKCVE